MFGVSSWEMMFLAVIALLLFGKNLPQVARSLGKGMMEFKKGLAGIDEEIYAATSRATSAPQSRPLPMEEREEAIAPKFEPPKSEPTATNTDQPA
jgi:sec-independent protein translocase protein TatA